MLCIDFRQKSVTQMLGCTEDPRHKRPLLPLQTRLVVSGLDVSD